MALSVTLVRRTKYSLAYLLVHDGQAGNTFNLDTMRADANIGGPLQALLATTVAADQAAQHLLGGYDDGGSADWGEATHGWATVRLTSLIGPALPAWSAVTLANAGNFRLQIGGPNAAATGLLEIEYKHSYDR
jgi:hypothetical protein